MRPGNACEKFAARWLVYVLGFFIVFFIGLAIAEGVRMVLMSIFYLDSILNGRLKEMFFSRATKSTGMIILCLMAPIVATQSFYVLGAMVWPRQSFLKTLVAEYALSFVYGLAAGITFMSLHSTGTWWASPGDDLPQWLALTLWLGGCAAVTVINYLLAWRRLTETDIISTRL